MNLVITGIGKKYMPLKNRTSSLVNSKLLSPLFCVGNVLILAVIVSEENSFVMAGSIVLGRMRKPEEQMRFFVMLKVCTVVIDCS